MEIPSPWSSNIRNLFKALKAQLVDAFRNQYFWKSWSILRSKNKYCYSTRKFHPLFVGIFPTGAFGWLSLPIYICNLYFYKILILLIYIYSYIWEPAHLLGFTNLNHIIKNWSYIRYNTETLSVSLKRPGTVEVRREELIYSSYLLLWPS